MSPLELSAALVGAVSVWLSTRQSLWAWPTAIVNVALYAVVFVGARLYADAGLQVVYAALSAYGWYEWRYGGARRTPLAVSRTPARLWPLLVGLAAGGSLLLGWLFHRYTDAAIPYVDSALTATSLVAQWMMTRKLVEHWLVWIAVDVVYVPVFASRGLWPTAAQACFLVTSFGFFARPRRPMPKPTAPEETTMTSVPALCSAASWAQRLSMRAVSNWPMPWVSTPVPSLTTMRLGWMRGRGMGRRVWVSEEVGRAIPNAPG